MFPFVPFYLDKSNNKTIYYDYKEKQFFSSGTGKQSSFFTSFTIGFSGLIGTILYNLMKNISSDIGFHSPITIVLFSLIIGGILACVSIGVTLYTIKKHLEQKKIILTLSEGEVNYFNEEGKKWYNTTLKIIFFLLSVTFVNSILLYWEQTKAVLFFMNTLFFLIFVIVVWVLRPMKRRTIYKHFQKELKRDFL